MLTNYPVQDNLVPAKGWFIFATLIVSLLLTMLPLKEIFRPLRPDFVALTLIYWSIHQPRQAGIGMAFGMGLLVDVSNTGILGQHALAYSIIGYISLALHQRLLYFNPIQQAPQIGFFLLIMQLTILVISLLVGSRFPGWYYFLATITGMLMWPVLTYILGILRKPKTESNSP